MSQTTQNSANIIKQEIYSDILQQSFKDHLAGLPGLNDLTSEFPEGDNFNVDQIGQATVSDYSENAAVDYSAIDTSRIQLQLTDYVQDGFYVTDKLKMDAPARASRMWSTRVQESNYAFGKRMEADLFAAANATQTAGSTNPINGMPFRHALPAGWTAQDFVDLIADLKLSWDKTNTPESGRIIFVDPTVENRMNKLASGGVLVSDSPRFEGLLETGFARNHRFVRNIHGFDIYTSNILPQLSASETVDSVTASAGGYVNIAMCVADEDCKPMMGVIRQRPTPEFDRNKALKRDEWSATARWGYALYRPESLQCLLTDPA